MAAKYVVEIYTLRGLAPSTLLVRLLYLGWDLTQYKDGLRVQSSHRVDTILQRSSLDAVIFLHPPWGVFTPPHHDGHPPNTDSNRHPSGGCRTSIQPILPYICDEQAESQLILFFTFTSQVTGWKPFRSDLFCVKPLVTHSLVLTLWVNENISYGLHSIRCVI